MISYYKCKELMILYIFITSLLPQAVKMSSSDKQQATIGRNFGAKLVKPLEFSPAIKEDNDNMFNKIQPSAYLPTNSLSEYLTFPSVVPQTSQASCYPTPYSTSDRAFGYYSSFHSPTMEKRKVKRILTTAQTLPGISMETLTFINILDQEYYGCNLVDDGSWSKVSFQTNLAIGFKNQVVKMFKQGKFFLKNSFLSLIF